MRDQPQRGRTSAKISSVFVVAVICLMAVPLLHAQYAVTTYHYDNYRTGWNSNETALTAANVHSTTFVAQHTTKLDDQVDAQPLVVPGVQITAGTYQGTV